MLARTTTALIVLVALVALAPVVGVVGAAGPIQDSQENRSENDATMANASTGAQLATVIQVTDAEVRHEVEVSSFEAEVDADEETARAEAIARMSAELRNRSASIDAEYRAATEAYESGELSRAEYGQRLAVLHARANAVLNGFDRVEAAAEQTSSVELAAAGYNASANAEARERIEDLAGRGSAALFAQFTGQSHGEFSVETENGLQIETESDDGEHSRSYEREEPEHGSFDVSRAEARATAEAALTVDADGSWVLQSVERDDDGYYTFEFVFNGNATVGEAEVSVDARSNTIFAFEEEIAPRGADDEDDADDDDRNDRDREDRRDELLAIEVVEGEPAPGATVTLQVTDADGEPVADAEVRVDYERVGTTDANGTITVTMPAKDDVSFDVEAGEAEGELDVEFTGELGPNDSAHVDAHVSDGTASITATYNDEPVAGADVYVNDELVGQTDAEGSISFAVERGEDYDVVLVKGSFEVTVDIEIPDAGGITVEEPEWEIEDYYDDLENDTEDEFEDELENETEDEFEDELENETEDEFENETENTNDTDDDTNETDDSTDDSDDSDTVTSLSITVTSGDLTANGSATVLVVDGEGNPVSGATVEVDSEVAGTTDADGELTVDLPDDDDARIEAEIDGASAREDLTLLEG